MLARQRFLQTATLALFGTASTIMAQSLPAIRVAGGAVDVGITNTLPLITAVEHGIPFQYLCSGGLINQDEIALCVAVNSPIRTGKDFEGRTVASSSLNDLNAVAIKAWTDETGGDSSKVRIVEIPFPQMGAALRRGTARAPYGTSLAPDMVQSVLDLAFKYKAVNERFRAAQNIAGL